ncbi:hypothetical protein [Streptomyces sp. Amel2xC10]|uniref:hypothetical protein n=1 Tax=Streptomyces sp. Amel2xC10 TaxID=1305826 RepID=UPI000A08FB98|nr:hypothetical protein [Streptomyces sp. Amel2xC10]SMF13331.1 hypothetical protein SAMN02745830_01731 [Streptomyces sp. Amel2xC10]
MVSTPVDDKRDQAEHTPIWAAPRGRHRRPRQRRVLFAAGGLALAAGVLSLVRLTSEPGGVAGLGTAEAEPHPDPVIGGAPSTGLPAEAGATVSPTPTNASPMGGTSGTPTPEASRVPSASGTPGGPASVAPVPGTGSGSAQVTPGAIPLPPRGPSPAPSAPDDDPRPAPTTPTRQPAPTPPAAPTTAPTAPAPAQPGHPGLCVPIIGLCVDALGGQNR